MKELSAMSGPCHGSLPAGSIPITLPGGNGTAVLCIHGFTGYPGEFAYLASRLNEAGYAVRVPRLPGHGTCTEDFLSYRNPELVRRCLDEFVDLKAAHEKVLVVGHSMGGLLAHMTAAVADPPKTVLIAPAFAIEPATIWLTPLLRYILKSVPGMPVAPGMPADEAYYARQYTERTWIGPHARLASLIKLARKTEPSRETDTLAVLGALDKTVPCGETRKRLDRIYRHRGIKFEIMNESDHLIHTGKERERAADLIIEFLETA